MEISEADMRRTVILLNELSAENRRLRRQRAMLRAALRQTIWAVENSSRRFVSVEVKALAMRGRR